MQSIFQRLLIPTLTILLHSCGKSFLESPPTNVLPRQEFVKDLSSCEQLLRGIYPTLSMAHYSYQDIYGELAADNVKPLPAAQYMIPMYSWSQIASNASSVTYNSVNLNGYSYAYYNIIRTCNFIIEKSNEYRNQNPKIADNTIGSALTIRAYAYHLLVNMFAQPYGFSVKADHPGIVYSTTSSWNNTVNGRSSVYEVYQAIAQDLQKAIPLLTDNTGSTLVVSKNLAIALLSRVQLYAGDWNGSLQNAHRCMEIVDLLTVGQGYPDNIYKKNTQQESEVFLHLVPYESASMGWLGGGIFSNVYYKLSPSFVATADIAALLTKDTNDVRKNWVQSTTLGWMVTKFASGAIPDVQPAEISYYQPVIRLSELYLNAAECCYFLQQEDNARQYIDQIRQRANPAALSVTATGAALLQLIQEERRKEMAFEGYRLFDLLRWKKDIVRSDPLSSDLARLPYPSDRAIAPLPIDDLSGNGVIQNPGY